MKQFGVAILALVYLGVSSGATVQLHYCMNKLVSWGFTDKTPAKCGKCGMSKHGNTGCCHDEQKVIKVAKDHKISENSFSLPNIKKLPPNQHITNNNIFYLSYSAGLNPNSHAPPLGQQVATYIYICVFRVWFNQSSHRPGTSTEG